MIKLFRHIRKSLLEQNKMGKYFKYALGEILLVVIGILIALQINNWNEESKTKAKEIEILIGFKQALEFDIPQMDSIILQYKRAKHSLKTVQYHLENNLPYTDSLGYHFFNTTLIYDSGGLTTGVYETLKSSGFDLISNKQIRDKIVFVYDEQNPWMMHWEKRYFDELFTSHKTLYQSRFTDFWGGDYKDPKVVGIMKPINYEKLKTDKIYLYHIKTRINLIGWLINKPAENTRKDCIELLALINQELKTDND